MILHIKMYKKESDTKILIIASQKLGEKWQKVETPAQETTLKINANTNVLFDNARSNSGEQISSKC